MTLRAVLRRSGVTLFLVRMLNRKGDRHRAALRQECARQRPSHAQVTFGEHSARLIVENEHE
jgi:hypothetical protein